MSIFDKFLNDSSNHDDRSAQKKTRTDNNRKEIGRIREDKAVRNIKEKLHNKVGLLQNIHLFHKDTDELCEIDALYVCKNNLHIIEIKSKNFTHLYGNTDTGHWYIEYGTKIVKSDNVFRQITRQMRILSSLLSNDTRVYGHIFLNNEISDCTMDIIGEKPNDVMLYTDSSALCSDLNVNNDVDRDLQHRIVKWDQANKKRLPKEWQ